MSRFDSGEYRGFLVETSRIYIPGRQQYVTIARRGSLEIESSATGKQARERCRQTVIEEIDKLLDRQALTR